VISDEWWLMVCSGMQQAAAQGEQQRSTSPWLALAHVLVNPRSAWVCDRPPWMFS